MLCLVVDICYAIHFSLSPPDSKFFPVVQAIWVHNPKKKSKKAEVVFSTHAQISALMSDPDLPTQPWKDLILDPLKTVTTLPQTSIVQKWCLFLFCLGGLQSP